MNDNRTQEQAEAIYRQRIADAEAFYRAYSGEFIERACPACGSWLRRSEEPFHAGPWLYGVAKCCRCTTLYVNPCPQDSHLETYYVEAKSVAMFRELCAVRPPACERIELVRRFAGDNGRVLEVGCGVGRAMEVSDRWRGIDIDPTAVRIAKDRGKQVSVGRLEQELDASCQVLCHFELVEHLISPWDFLSHAWRILEPNGIMIFTTPNGTGTEMAYCGYNAFRFLAHGIFPPFHLQAISVVNVAHLLLTTGFDILELTTPGRLDADLLELLEAMQPYLIAGLASSHMQVVARRSNTT